MSYHDGMAALSLQMPPRVPRTEYSLESHWPLIRRALGINVNESSPQEAREAAQEALVKAYNYDFVWSILTHCDALGDFRTKMGHAVYAAGGVDFNTDTGCPFATVDDALRFDPLEKYGAINPAAQARRYEAAYRRQCERFPDAVNMTGIYITCMSGLIEIFGWEMLLEAAGTDPARFGEITNRYAEWIGQYFAALAQSDVPVVMVHDDIVWSSGAFIHPDWYRKYIFPNYKKLFRPLLDSGKKVVYTSDGDYTAFIDDVAAAGVHGFVMEPLTDMRYVAEKYGKTHAFIGNADTRVLLTGTKDDIRAEVRRCMDIGKKYPGFFLAVGNHIPANTPVDSVLYYNEAYEEMSKR